MPSVRNHVLFQGWTVPLFVGQGYLRDSQDGWNTLPGEDQQQILTYWRERAVGQCTLWTGNSSTNGLSLCNPIHEQVYKPFREATGAPSGAQYQLCRNKAYSRFRNKAVGENSAVGVFAAERREAFGMVARRVMGLARAYRSLRKGNFRQFLRELSVNPKRKHRNVVRTASQEAAGLWLEYWFGWSPTVNDIYSTVDVLTQELPQGKYYGSARTKIVSSERTNYSGGNYELEEIEAYYKARTGATIRLVNPNLFLANQLGLANPLTIAWEVIPFSFVVDWFTKFGDVLQSYTDWVGLELSYPWRSYILSGIKHTYFRRAQPSFNAGASFPTHVSSYRHKGLISPCTVVPVIGNFGKSKTRAATAVSLLVSLFLGGGNSPRI